MQSQASSPRAYLEALPEERKPVMEALRETILQNLPPGFEEEMSYGTIGYIVPHRLYPSGYHCNPKLPLPFMSIASQKNYISVYHMAMYGGELTDWFLKEWPKHSAKKLDMGKCCIRFKKPDDVPLNLIGQLAGKVTPDEWISQYEKEYKR